MGQFGRIKSLDELPNDDIIRKYLREAIELNKKGVKIPKKKTVKKELKVPDYLITAIRTNYNAFSTFEAFSYSNRKEYVEWMAVGKVRNWNYVL